MNYTNAAANTLNVNLLGGNDTLEVNGSTQADVITVDVTVGTVNTGLVVVSLTSLGGNIEALSIFAHARR